MARFNYVIPNCNITITIATRFWFVMKVTGSTCGQTTWGMCPIKNTTCKYLLELTSGRKFRNALWRHISAVFSHHGMRVKKYEYNQCLKKLYCGLTKQNWHDWDENKDEAYKQWLNPEKPKSTPTNVANEFIYLWTGVFPTPVKVVDTTTFKTKEGHILWQIENEQGNTYIVSPMSLKEN